MTVTTKPTSFTTGWLSGLLLGGVTGLTTISFALGLLGGPILLASVLLIAWKGPRLPAYAGLLTGWSVTWLALLIQATFSCLTVERGPEHWCEPSDVTPWVVASAVGLGTALALSAWALRRAHR